MNAISSPIMIYHGGKFRLAPFVLSHFPEHDTYVDLFGGAASVLLRKPRSHGEVYNDLDASVGNVMRVLQDPITREKLTERIIFTPYSRDEFVRAHEPAEDPVEQAARTIIRAQMGFGSAGATKESTGFRFDSARACNTAAHLWAKYPEKIRSFGLRLQGVIIETRPALQVLANHDRPGTLIYADPPYLHETRKMGWTAGYRYEMTDADHIELLHALKNCKSMVVLSGYPSDLYNDLLQGWRCVTTSARISAGRGPGKRTEALWLSPNISERLAA